MGLGHHGGLGVVSAPVIYNSVYAYGRHNQGGGYTHQQTDSGLAAGKRYFNEGKYDLAIDAFLQAVLAAPQDGVPKLYFGSAMMTSTVVTMADLVTTADLVTMAWLVIIADLVIMADSATMDLVTMADSVAIR